MDKGCCSNMQDLFRIAHYLAHNDHYEVAGVVNQLAAINHKIPPSVKLRISFYNLRKFCESSFVLSDESFEFFHKKFEKLEAMCKFNNGHDVAWCEFTRLFFIQRSITKIFIKLGISSAQRRDEVWAFNKTENVSADDVVLLVKDINRMFDRLLVLHPIPVENTASFNDTLCSVTTDLFGRGKISNTLKLSKKKLVNLVNTTGHLPHFLDLLLTFLKVTETQVLPVPVGFDFVEGLVKKSDEDELPEYVVHFGKLK